MTSATNRAQLNFVRAMTTGSIPSKKTIPSSAIDQWISGVQASIIPVLGKRKLSQITATSFSQGANVTQAFEGAMPQIATPQSSQNDDEASEELPTTPSTAPTLLFPFPSDCEPLSSDSDSD